MADDYSNDKNTTALLAPNNFLIGKLETHSDVDWLRFDTTARGLYRFSTINPDVANPQGATISPYLNVFDAEGRYVHTNYGVLETTSGGTYFIQLSSGGIGTYAVQATVLSDDYGSGSQNAATLSSGGSLGGSVNYLGDIDRFKISLTAGGYYTFKLSASLPANDDALQLSAHSADGAYLGSASAPYSGGPVQLTIRPTVSGDYYVDASGSNYGVDRTPLAYTLSASLPAQDEFGNTQATASTVTVGSTVSGALQDYADVDMFKVMLTAGRTYSYSWDDTTGGTAPSRMSTSVQDAAGNILGGELHSEVKYKTFTPTFTGYHYLSLASREGGYTLAIQQAADDFSASTSTTGKLAVGGEIKGKLEAGGGDRDWIAVNLTAGTTYWLSAKLSSGYTYGGAMRLLDNTGKELAQTSHLGPVTITDTLPYVATRSGTHFVELATSGNAADDYVLSVIVGERDDHGGASASATPLALDTRTTGKLELSHDQDVFKLNVEAGKSYGILPALVDYHRVNLSANDKNGQWVPLESWYSAPGGVEAKVFTATTSGELFIKVSGYSAGPYALTASVFGPDDYGHDAAGAGILAPGGSIQGALSNPVDRDAIRITLQAGKSYVFALLGATSGNGSAEAAQMHFSVNSAYSSELGQIWLRNSAEPRVMVTPASTGDVLINLSGYNGHMGSYTVKAITLSGDATGPTMVAHSHAPGATNVPLTSSNIELSFSEPIAIDRSAVVLRNSGGKAVELAYVPGASSPYVSDNKLVLNVGTFLTPDTYTLTLPRQAVHDLAGNPHQGPETLTFTTVMPGTAASAGDDLLAGVRGGIVSGGAGIDTVVYGADVYIEQFDRSGNTTTITSYAGGTKSTDVLVDVERVIFGRNSYALDIDGNGGQAYRLYRAAFDRTPDLGGVGFWMKHMDKGMSLGEVAGFFLNSPEALGLYGPHTTDTQFVTQLYQNVLDRGPEAQGLQFWLDVLGRGVSRADVLTGFSESPENIAAVASIIGEGFTYTLS